MSEDYSALARSLADIQETLKVVEEAARGYRQHLEAQGWSPSMAEQVAATAFFVPVLRQLVEPSE